MTTKSISNIFILSVLFLAFIPKDSVSQLFKSNTELGFKGGVSYYTGDLNSDHFSSANPAASFIVRRNLDRRFSLKGEVGIMSIDACHWHTTTAPCKRRAFKMNKTIRS